MAKLLAAAQRAAALDDEDSVAHLMLSIAYMWPNEDELSIAAGERAIELNPSNALALVSLGNILDLVGRATKGSRRSRAACASIPVTRTTTFTWPSLAAPI
jgi:adenylate cyclase